MGFPTSGVPLFFQGFYDLQLQNIGVFLGGFQSHGSRTTHLRNAALPRHKGPSFCFFLFPASNSAYFCDPCFKVFLYFCYSTQLVASFFFCKKNSQNNQFLYKKGEVSLVGYHSIKSIFVIVIINTFSLTSHAWTSPTNSCWIDCMPYKFVCRISRGWNLGCCIWFAGFDLEIFAWRTPSLWYFRSAFLKLLLFMESIYSPAKEQTSKLAVGAGVFLLVQNDTCTRIRTYMLCIL